MLKINALQIFYYVTSKSRLDSPSGKHGDSDKSIYNFKIFKISIITIRITYHQIRLGSLGTLHNICQSWLGHQFWYLMANNQISDHQRLKLQLLKNFTSGSFISILYILFQFYLILVSSYFLVLDHLTLQLNKSHNILEKNQRVTTKLLYFVQLTGCQKCLALFE